MGVGEFVSFHQASTIKKGVATRGGHDCYYLAQVDYEKSKGMTLIYLYFTYILNLIMDMAMTFIILLESNETHT